MKVTEVSRHSYCMYYLLGSSAYVIALVIKNQASELGKHPLFGQTAYGPAAPAKCRAGDLRHIYSPRRGCCRRPARRGSMFNKELLTSYPELASCSPGPEAACRHDLADGDDRLRRQRSRRGSARDHVVIINGSNRISPRDSDILRRIASAIALYA